ncbi:MAG: STM4504/CBY_0614 family protein [Pseudanabaena sp.]|jgi:hypothetical protein
MAIVNLYSKRKKAIERITQPEVYQYTDLPIPFRRQVIYIWETAIGLYNGQISSLARNVWTSVYKSLTRELGLLILAPDQLPDSSFEQCRSFFLNQATHTDNLLDLIELTFNCIEYSVPKLFEEYKYADKLLPQTSEDAIEELNHRFLEHGIGYQYNNGQIIRIDSVFLHAEAVVPALTLISSEGFSGAEQEFRSAHQHYRNQEYKAAIVESLKAFESTMKTICDKFSWAYDKNATASKLIDVVLKEELIPKYLQDHLTGLTNVLKAGVPTVRNKTSGHGQGSETKEVPEYLAAYALHLTASNIVLLVEAYKTKCSEITS